MWIKDIRNYDIVVYRNNEVIYSGNVEQAPDDIKKNEARSMKIEHKKIIIEVI